MNNIIIWPMWKSTENWQKRIHMNCWYAWMEGWQTLHIPLAIARNFIIPHELKTEAYTPDHTLLMAYAHQWAQWPSSECYTISPNELRLSVPELCNEQYKTVQTNQKTGAKECLTDLSTCPIPRGWSTEGGVVQTQARRTWQHVHHQQTSCKTQPLANGCSLDCDTGIDT